MEPQIWVKSEEKWAYIFLLLGQEAHRLKVTGNMLTLKRNLQKVLDALQEGRAPADAGAKSVETLDVRTLSRAQVSPVGSLTLWGDGEKPKKLKFSPAESNGAEILQDVLARSGRTFQSTEEEVGLGEAILPPLVVGGLCGLFWMGVYDAATKLAGGEQVEVHGVRRRGLQRLLITVAETLGTTGTIAIGVVLLLLVLFWLVRVITKRPRRTVWLPQAS